MPYNGVLKIFGSLAMLRERGPIDNLALLRRPTRRHFLFSPASSSEYRDRQWKSLYVHFNYIKVFAFL